MKPSIIPTILLVSTVIILGMFYFSINKEVQNYDVHTGQAVKGEDFWQDYATGNSVADDNGIAKDNAITNKTNATRTQT